jgi:hypothetical protein
MILSPYSHAMQDSDMLIMYSVAIAVVHLVNSTSCLAPQAQHQLLQPYATLLTLHDSFPCARWILKQKQCLFQPGNAVFFSAWVTKNRGNHISRNLRLYTLIGLLPLRI